MNIVFDISGAIAVAATVIALTRVNAVHALLYLIVSLMAIAVAFYALGAAFVAALEVIVYAGAIMVLFVFVVMLLNLGQAAVLTERQLLQPGTWIGPGILCAMLIAELLFLEIAGTAGAARAGMISPRQVGMALYGPYLLGVEMASMLLLAGLAAAYHLGSRKFSRPEAQ